MVDATVARKKSSSFDLVCKEIEHTIQEAEGSLERFQENRESGEDLQNCIDCLNQLRGIFTLVELQGGTVLCQEMVAQANEVPVGALEDKNGLLATLSQALFILRRYVDYYSTRREDHPELLLPIINDLRQARKAKALPDSYFFDVTFPRPVLSSIDNLQIAADVFESRCRRLRHMYQIGLLELLHTRDLKLAFNLIERSAKGFSRICANAPLAEYWGLVALAGRVMRDAEMEITQPRKRLFMRVEKYTRELVHVGKVAATRSASETLLKDLLYLIALSGIRDDNIRMLFERYKVVEPDLDERKLVAHRSQLMGPGTDVLRSLAAVLQEELGLLKDKLDIVERGVGIQEADFGSIANELGRLADTLVMLNLNQLASKTRAQQGIIQEWDRSRRFPDEQELMSVADAVLSIEQAVMQLEGRGITSETDHLASAESSVADSPYLAEANIVVVSEAQQALSLAKRAIVAFIEAAGDKMHLVNVPKTLHAVWGSLVMMESPEVARIVENAGRYIQEALIDSEQIPGEQDLETLADALTSLEYFIESLGRKGEGNAELLKLAEESLRSLGY